MLKIALPNKGRLADDVRELFADAGLDVHSRSEHALVASLGGEFEAIFARAGREITIVPVSGAAEIAPHLGIADIVVDLTSTGSTLRVHNLREVATVLESR